MRMRLVLHDLVRVELLVCVQRCASRQWHSMPVWWRLLVAIVTDCLRNHSHMLGHVVGMEPIPIARMHGHVCCADIRFEASGWVAFEFSRALCWDLARRWRWSGSTYLGSPVVCYINNDKPGGLLGCRRLTFMPVSISPVEVWCSVGGGTRMRIRDGS